MDAPILKRALQVVAGVSILAVAAVAVLIVAVAILGFPGACGCGAPPEGVVLNHYDHANETASITFFGPRGETVTAGNVTILANGTNETWAEMDALDRSDVLQRDTLKIRGVQAGEQIKVTITAASGEQEMDFVVIPDRTQRQLGNLPYGIERGRTPSQ